MQLKICQFWVTTSSLWDDIDYRANGSVKVGVFTDDVALKIGWNLIFAPRFDEKSFFNVLLCLKPNWD